MFQLLPDEIACVWLHPQAGLPGTASQGDVDAFLDPFAQLTDVTEVTSLMYLAMTVTSATQAPCKQLLQCLQLCADAPTQSRNVKVTHCMTGFAAVWSALCASHIPA